MTTEIVSWVDAKVQQILAAPGAFGGMSPILRGKTGADFAGRMSSVERQFEALPSFVLKVVAGSNVAALCGCRSIVPSSWRTTIVAREA